MHSEHANPRVRIDNSMPAQDLCTVLNIPTLVTRRSFHISPQETRLQSTSALSVLLGDAVSGGDLVTETVVLVGEALGLLLESLNVAVLGGKLFLQTTNLSGTTGVVESTGALALVDGRVTLHASVLLLKTENVEDHGVGAVEDEGEEESETTEVHVALRVELAGLDLHTLGTTNGGGTRRMISKRRWLWVQRA